MNKWFGVNGIREFKYISENIYKPKLIKDLSVKNKPCMCFKKSTESFYNLEVGKDFLIMTPNLETLMHIFKKE